MGKVNLFVYGSLKRGEQHHHRIKDLRNESGRTQGQLWELTIISHPTTFERGASNTPPNIHKYPVLIQNNPSASGETKWVHGEMVFGVSEELLQELDQFEGVDRKLYSRVSVMVLTPSGRHTAQTYVMTEDAIEQRGLEPCNRDSWTSHR